MKKIGKKILLTIFLVVNIIYIYTIIEQQKQTEQLEQQLQEVQMKYEIIKNDPLTRDAMEAGG
jgi:preprotein translocase subunit YajC